MWMSIQSNHGFQWNISLDGCLCSNEVMVQTCQIAYTWWIAKTVGGRRHQLSLHNAADEISDFNWAWLIPMECRSLRGRIVGNSHQCLCKVLVHRIQIVITTRHLFHTTRFFLWLDEFATEVINIGGIHRSSWWTHRRECFSYSLHTYNIAIRSRPYYWLSKCESCLTQSGSE